jgi:hypothetical protein
MPRTNLLGVDLVGKANESLWWETSQNGHVFWRLFSHEGKSRKSTPDVIAFKQWIWTIDYSFEGAHLATGISGLKAEIWDTLSGANVLTMADFAN